MPGKSQRNQPQDESTLPVLEEVERRHTLRVLAACEGNRTTTAMVLGVDRKTLRRKLVRWGIADEAER